MDKEISKSRRNVIIMNQNKKSAIKPEIGREESRDKSIRYLKDLNSLIDAKEKKFG